MTPPYQERPCETCRFRVNRPTSLMVDGLMVMVGRAYCNEKSIDITGRTGPCSRYEEAD
ncbi:MAG: hypothetical protein IJT54_04180 [Candidatus Methanomethylophilaceae archaeon]|nr:hypothetical protein [Candidatus Methanomethylophilaceae archaeon]